MYACAELFCVLTKVSNKFVFGRFPLRGPYPLSPPACAPARRYESTAWRTDSSNTLRCLIF